VCSLRRTERRRFLRVRFCKIALESPPPGSADEAPKAQLLGLKCLPKRHLCSYIANEFSSRARRLLLSQFFRLGDLLFHCAPSPTAITGRGPIRVCKMATEIIPKADLASVHVEQWFRCVRRLRLLSRSPKPSVFSLPGSDSVAL